jgi:hypothetical protein
VDGVGAVQSITGNTIDADGWTMVLDSGSSAAA